MPRTRNRSAHRQPAFSIVELMIVILIIALLAAILVPTLNKAYKTALATADSALISQITMGCEAYHQAFNAYPPSTWVDMYSSANPRPTGWWPPPVVPAGVANPAVDTVALSGAAKVYASLSGFNTIGTTATPVGCDGGPANIANWREPCGQLTYRGILVPDAPGSLTERQPAYGPYYLGSEKQQTRTTVAWGTLTAVQQEVFCSRFERENPPRPSTGGTAERGAPILYYAANQFPTDTDPSGQPGYGTIDSWDIYSYADNYLITGPTGTTPSLAPDVVLPRDRRRHVLYAPSDGKTAKNGNWNLSLDPEGLPARYGITRPFAKNPSGAADITYPAVPYNADSFILISPGPDGEYFTADDITNFKQ